MAASWTLVAVVAAVLCGGAQAQTTCVVADCPATDCRVAACVMDACAETPAADGTSCSTGTCAAGACVPSTNPTTQPVVTTTTTPAPENGASVFSDAGSLVLSVEAGNDVLLDIGNGAAPRVSIVGTIAAASVEAGRLAQLAETNSKAYTDTEAARLATLAESNAKTYTDTEAARVAQAAENNAKAYTDLETGKLDASKANQSTLTAEIASLRAELGGVEAILGGKLAGLNTTQGNQLGALEADLAALDIAVATKASTADLTALTTQVTNQGNSITDKAAAADLVALTALVNQVLVCNDMGKFYSRSSKSCVDQPVVKAPATGTCDSNNAGSLVFQSGDLKVCSGTAFEALGGSPLGTTATNPAASCNQIFTAGQGSANGVRFIKDGNSVVRHFCEFTSSAGIDRGGDGSSAAVPVVSCANYKTYYGKTARTTLFVDLDGNLATKTDIVQGDCSDGVFLGGDGSSASKPARACNTIPAVTGRRFVTPDMGTPFQVYCQGGWSLLMRIIGSSSSHVRNNAATCGGVVNPNSGACKLSAATISRFFVQPGVQVTRVDPDANGYISYYQRSASDTEQWPSVLECNRRNSHINPNSRWRWILTSYSSESNARDNRSPDTGDYLGSGHFYPTPYSPNQIFFCVNTGMRINTAFTSSSCCRDGNSGTLWVK